MAGVWLESLSPLILHVDERKSQTIAGSDKMKLFPMGVGKYGQPDTPLGRGNTHGIAPRHITNVIKPRGRGLVRLEADMLIHPGQEKKLGLKTMTENHD